MIRINLLPHREIRRARRQRAFYLMLLGGAIAGLATIFFGQIYIANTISAQASRNARLAAAIARFDKDLVEIKVLKSKIRDVVERKRVVENLQSDRSRAVILLDEISRKLPEGVYLKSIKQQGNQITLVGVADSNARVVTLVKSINDSTYLSSANLLEIKSEMVNNVKQNIFNLTATQKNREFKAVANNSPNQPTSANQPKKSTDAL